MSANEVHTNFALSDVVPSLEVAQVEMLRPLGRRHRVVNGLCCAFVVNEDRSWRQRFQILLRVTRCCVLLSRLHGCDIIHLATVHGELNFFDQTA